MQLSFRGQDGNTTNSKAEALIIKNGESKFHVSFEENGNMIFRSIGKDSDLLFMPSSNNSIIIIKK